MTDTNPGQVKPTGARPSRGRKLRLEPADPFDLIRWLARSQSDPRKAVAELVQNSFDAGAAHVTVERSRRRGVISLVVRDDGSGVLAEMSREDALEYLARNVGHSRKLGLSASERHERVVAGKYGVGLLGFWSIGHTMTLVSRVAASEILALVMVEDSAEVRIEPRAARIGGAETYTEITIAPVHDAAQRVLSGRRLSDYLASELRGQLLARDVALVVHDKMARGPAQKVFAVVPRRFTGERLALPDVIEITGFPPLRVELYLSRGAERAAVQVACAGTLVADDIAELGSLGLAEPPWTGNELTGLLDFAGFNVPPGTRRGVAPDAAAATFVRALEADLRPLVLAELVRLEGARRAAADRSVARELRKALRGFAQRLPQYEFPASEQGSGDAGSGARPGHATPGEGDGDLRSNAADDDEGPAHDPGATLPLIPAGPLAQVRITPDPVRIAPGAERRVRGVATDAEGRPVDDVTLSWTVSESASLGLVEDRPYTAVAVAADARAGQVGTLAVTATQGERTASATATVAVVAAADRAGNLGIPDPRLVSDSDGAWRSRMSGAAWEVNDAHEDYRALRDDPKARLRYLLALLAKEIVLRSTGRVETTDVLESLVEVLAHAERNLRGG